MPSTILPSFSLIGPAISESISDKQPQFSVLPKARFARLGLYPPQPLFDECQKAEKWGCSATSASYFYLKSLHTNLGSAWQEHTSKRQLDRKTIKAERMWSRSTAVKPPGDILIHGL